MDVTESETTWIIVEIGLSGMERRDEGMIVEGTLEVVLPFVVDVVSCLTILLCSRDERERKTRRGSDVKMQTKISLHSSLNQSHD